MLAIPVDVLREILEHVDKSDLATICRVNKTCCSCSQNVLYRNIYGDERVIRTLARSTDLARRVRSFEISSNCPELATALRNMSSLRRLKHSDLYCDPSILDGCTFKLDSLICTFRYCESLHKFLDSQSSLTEFAIYCHYIPPPSFEATFLPNLTRVGAQQGWARILIPGRPVSEVMVIEPWDERDSVDLEPWDELDPVDFSIFTLSTALIRKLHINYSGLYHTTGSHLASISPSLEHLTIEYDDIHGVVRIPYICLFNRC